MIIALDHVALRLNDKSKGFDILKLLGYKIEDTFELDFGEAGKAESYATSGTNLTEIFITDGAPNTVIGEWVEKNGPGIHHIAFKTNDIQEDIYRFKEAGVKFTTEEFLSCDDLKQIFTVPQEALGGIVIELIERKTKGFCAANIKALIESTKGKS